MNIVVMGCGYVGLVTGACFAEMGNLVTCVDNDPRRLSCLRMGILPFFEPGLESLIQRNVQHRRLSFASDPSGALASADMAFIAVGTPPRAQGGTDMHHVMAATTLIGRDMRPDCIVVSKSTAPVGTVEQIRGVLRSATAERGLHCDPIVVANPEFLREGSAVQDFMSPDRVVVGVDEERAEEAMRRLYAPFVRNHDRFIIMGVRDAELTKYAANAMLATRISFMNEMARLCDAFGADVESVRRGIGSDERIGHSYLYAGCGYGGSCFPKDVDALIDMGRHAGIDTRILSAVTHTNDEQKKWALAVIARRFGQDLRGRYIAVWGLSFKPGTDDLRESPAVAIVRDLLAAGAQVQVHDPVAMPRAQAELSQDWFTSGKLRLMPDAYAALENADALVLATEWKPYRAPDFDAMMSRMRGRLLVDGRNQYDPKYMRALGFDYCGVGRGAAMAQRSMQRAVAPGLNKVAARQAAA